MKSPVSRCRRAVFLMAFISAHVLAQTDGSNISAVVANQRASITSAKIVLIPGFLIADPNVNEKNLNKWGCTYEVKDATSVMSIIDVVANAEVKSHPNSGFYRYGIDYRIGIYLNEDSDKTHALLFEGSSVKRPLYGIYNGTTKVLSLNPSFAEEVRAWAVNRKAEGKYCSRRDSDENEN